MIVQTITLDCEDELGPWTVALHSPRSGVAEKAVGAEARLYPNLYHHAGKSKVLKLVAYVFMNVGI